MTEQQTLQHKYRPDSLDTFFGNKSAVDTLTDVLNRDHPPKSYLISGPAGCGKTTLAYIIRDVLGCAISSFHEFDASADRGIDKIRVIKQEAKLLPLSGDKIIMFFDECHQITGPAQEAMLKLLETPPPHVYLILATTEPHKLKQSVIRRCTQIAVDRLSRGETVDLLSQVCEAEGKGDKWNKKFFSRIYKMCWGSPGQALKLLDQVIDMKKEKDAINAIQEVTFDDTLVIDLCKVLYKPDMSAREKWIKCRDLLRKFGGNAETARIAMLGYFNKILLDTGSPTLAHTMSLFTDSAMHTGKAGLTLACYYACKDMQEAEDERKK